MRHGSSGWISLHAGEFFLLWRSLGFGEPPTALGIASGGRTSAARAALRDSANRSLHDHGLGTVERPAEDLVRLLRALAEPLLRCDVRIISHSVGTFRAVGAYGPHGHVTAGLTEGLPEVRIGPVSEYTLVATMFEGADEVAAGVGSPGNVPVDEYLRACRAGERAGTDVFLDVLRGAGARPPEANTFLRAVRQANSIGAFGGSVLDSDGRWVRSPSTVNWVDTPDGRYALRKRGGWVTVTPADRPRLVSMAEELVAELGGPSS